jgi:hypothetical protein
MTRLRALPRVSVQTSALVSIVLLVSVQPNRGTKCVTHSAIAERYKHPHGLSTVRGWLRFGNVR